MVTQAAVMMTPLTPMPSGRIATLILEDNGLIKIM
jgi:hypothetical protein